MIAQFPYHSQWGDVACNAYVIEQEGDPADIFDWKRAGFGSHDAYLFWSRRVCGLACLQSVLKAWGVPPVGIVDLIKLASEARALYRDSLSERAHGLFYAPFLQMIEKEFLITGEVVFAQSVEALAREVDEGAVAMASVSTEIRYPNLPNVRQGGHLILIYRAIGGDIVFHNPSGIHPYASSARLPISSVDRFFAGRGMILRRPQCTSR